MKNNVVIENRVGLLAEKYCLIGKNEKLPTFGGKGRYIIPIKILKGNSSNYTICLEKNYKNLKFGTKYYVDYRLVKLCDTKTYNELIKKINH
jgi:hypothetical protein